jgi:hypothetical protein
MGFSEREFNGDFGFDGDLLRYCQKIIEAHRISCGVKFNGIMLI